jgi:hypothetical protein
MGKIRNAWTISFQKHQQKRPPERYRNKWEENIKKVVDNKI